MKEIQKKLYKKYVFYINVISGKVYFKEKKSTEFKEFTVVHQNSILNYLCSKNVKITKAKLIEIIYSDSTESINPISKYFEELPAWDKKTDYINELANTLKTNNQPFFEKVFKKWIVGMVACALNPNSTNQQALILCGKQGCGKTTWLENLLPSKLKDYLYNGSIDPKNKDTKIAMSQYLLMNMDELSSYNAKDVNAFKELITKTVITERLPYGQSSGNYDRICSFTGSSNDTGILIDTTGNRRFLCFEIDGLINNNHNVDINLVMAQAYCLYKEGYKTYFDHVETKEIEENNEHFMKTNPVAELIGIVIEKPLDDKDYVLMNATDIYSLIKEKKNTPFISVESIGKLMTSLGYCTKKDKNGTKKYKVKLIN